MPSNINPDFIGTGPVSKNGMKQQLAHARDEINALEVQVQTRLPLAGGTLTGPLTLHANPTADMHAATRLFVEQHVTQTTVAKSGDTMTGALTLPGAPTAANHAATKAYVDGETAGRVAKTGDTMTGFLTLHADPTAPMHAATKQYVDRGFSGVVTASGSAVDFVGIPSEVTQVRLFLSGVGVSSARYLVQLGGASIITSGYFSRALSTGSNSNTLHYVTNGFVLNGYAEISSTAIGIVDIYLIDSSTNRWVFTSCLTFTNPANSVASAAGDISLNTTLQQLRISPTSGTFTEGSLSLEWRV